MKSGRPDLLGNLQRADYVNLQTKTWSTITGT